MKEYVRNYKAEHKTKFRTLIAKSRKNKILFNISSRIFRNQKIYETNY